MQATNKRRGMLGANDVAAGMRLAGQASYMLQLAGRHAAHREAAARAAAVTQTLRKVCGAGTMASGGAAAPLSAASGVLDDVARNVVKAQACHVVPTSGAEESDCWELGAGGTVKVSNKP
jgi:hypothetical protein